MGGQLDFESIIAELAQPINGQCTRQIASPPGWPVGTSSIVAPNLMHGVVALEKGPLIDTFTPRRDDYIF